MTEQLSLFQTPSDRTAEGLAAAEPMPAEADAGAIDELFRITHRWRNRCQLLELLEFLARLTPYSPLNAFLIHLQDPDATRVATARVWARKYQRRLLPGARPIVILAPMSPVLFVFDVRETEGPPLAPNALPASGPSGRPARLLEATLHNCGIQRIAVRDAEGLDPSAERAIQLTPALREKACGSGAGAQRAVPGPVGRRAEPGFEISPPEPGARSNFLRAPGHGQRRVVAGPQGPRFRTNRNRSRRRRASGLPPQ
jgi:hypothetical protein